MLALLALTGIAVRHVFNLRGRGKPTGPTIAIAVILALASVTYVSWEKSGPRAPAGHVTYSEVAPIIATHCASCHNVAQPPRGVALDSFEHVRAAAPRIKAMAVDAEIMPLGNPTHMSRAERDRLGAWIAAGSPR